MQRRADLTATSFDVTLSHVLYNRRFNETTTPPTSREKGKQTPFDTELTCFVVFILWYPANIIFLCLISRRNFRQDNENVHKFLHIINVMIYLLLPFYICLKYFFCVSLVMSCYVCY